jgi:pyrrolysine biosynthesis protein PylD
VGKSAAFALVELGAHVSVYDVDLSRSKELAGRVKEILESEIDIEVNLDDALRRHRIYFDASPSPGFIHSELITPETFIAAPGLPLGVTLEGQHKIRDRLLHDPLQIGVATMLMDALYGNKEKILP